jgi:hypothetical protein
MRQGVMMTDQETEAEPVTLERGRYRISQAPDGGWVVARAVGTCEQCQGCGCGTAADLITVPAMVLKMAGAPGMMGKLRGMLGGTIGGGTNIHGK